MGQMRLTKDMTLDRDIDVQDKVRRLVGSRMLSSFLISFDISTFLIFHSKILVVVVVSFASALWCYSMLYLLDVFLQYALLEARVYQKPSFYLHKVGVRSGTHHPPLDPIFGITLGLFVVVVLFFFALDFPIIDQ